MSIDKLSDEEALGGAELMKLSELVTHTSLWTDIPRAVVESHSRYLREGGLLTTGGRGLAAPDMTDVDKVSLLVAVLGCGTSRTCADDLPALLALPTKKQLSKKDEMRRPDFFLRDNLKDALLRMFSNIRDGTIENWPSFIASEFKNRGAEIQLSDVDPLALIVTFEIDLNYVQIRLGTQFESTDPSERSKKYPFQPVMQTTMEFGESPTSPVAGYSRRLHEISYERLKGWGTCLTGEVA